MNFGDQRVAVVFDEHGLAPAIVQDASTKEVLMLAYVDAESLRRTREDGATWFWSRSRRRYWTRGPRPATSRRWWRCDTTATPRRC